jgi:UDP-N-acetyl-D-glucosamine dehydrogenase
MSLIEKIMAREARIAVIGLGYVGLPLVIEFCKAGFAVTGFDVDPVKVEMLKAGKSYIKHIDAASFAPFIHHTCPPLAGVPGVVAHSPSPTDDSSGFFEVNSKLKTQNSKLFEATCDFSLLRDMDCIIICVPTPLNKNREPDMQYVFNTTRTIAGNLQRGQLIILESTTYPGTTDGDMRKILEDTGLKAGVDFHLAFSPEREDPNNRDFSVRTIPKVVGGYTEGCLKAATTLYGCIVDRTVPVSSTKVAEAAKLLENIYRSVNIALVNELKILFDKMGIDVWEVIDAAKTKPFGYQAFYPGPGLGGHCIPIDPFYLTWKAREYDFRTRFIELAGEINTSMPDYVVMKVMKALNEQGKSVRGSKILLLGLAYKANVDDDRESPSYHLMEKLEQLGATVSYNDPHIPEIKLTREYAKYAGRKSEKITKEYDLMLIATAHDEYRQIDFTSLGLPVVDTRNLITDRNASAVYRA